ncbi:Histone-lysine N-methyltransferase, H3 lysine-79 specific, partial [Ophiophagus hannah]
MEGGRKREQQKERETERKREGGGRERNRGREKEREIERERERKKQREKEREREREREEGEKEKERGREKERERERERKKYKEREREREFHSTTAAAMNCGRHLKVNQGLLDHLERKALQVELALQENLADLGNQVQKVHWDPWDQKSPLLLQLLSPSNSSAHIRTGNRLSWVLSKRRRSETSEVSSSPDSLTDSLSSSLSDTSAVRTGCRGEKGEKGDAGIGQRGETGPPGLAGVGFKNPSNWFSAQLLGGRGHGGCGLPELPGQPFFTFPRVWRLPSGHWKDPLEGENRPVSRLSDFWEACFSPSQSLHMGPSLICIQNGPCGDSWKGKDEIGGASRPNRLNPTPAYDCCSISMVT